MLLRERYESQGQLFFRWRSYWPYLLLPLLAGALSGSGGFEQQFGESAEFAWDIFCIVFALVGAGVRIATVGFVPGGTSGRNTREQRAEHLNTTGIYSVVRNPLYVGNIITLIAFALATKVWWFPPIIAALALLFYERVIFTEEAFLLEKFGKPYVEWSGRTPALVPRLRNWYRPDIPFSLRAAIRREYHGVFLIVVVLTAIEFLTDLVGEGESLADWFQEGNFWNYLLGFSLGLYFVIRWIRKRTSWLVVEGR